MGTARTGSMVGLMVGRVDVAAHLEIIAVLF
jgi:hypothetical protein